MRIQSLRATTTLSSLHSSSAIYNVNNNNNQQKFFGTVSSSISRTRGLCIRCGVRFRPCIDIHKGKVKQIVGSIIQDLKESSSTPLTNFESDKSAAVYANLYKEDGLIGGHVIMIGADPYVFNNGQMDLQRLKELVCVVGRQRLVLDLSCRKKEGKYAIVTDRWQKFTDVCLDQKILDFLAIYADEFLVHGVDVEGKKLGIDEELVTLLGRHSPIPVTYAGGVTVMADLEKIKSAGMESVDVTVGSALDIFGGNLAYKDVVAWHGQQKALAV
ncbi:hypothetical protein ACSBR2_002683 [Camellia fascicularis]